MRAFTYSYDSPPQARHLRRSSLESAAMDIDATIASPWTPRSCGLTALNEADGSLVEELLHGGMPVSPMKVLAQSASEGAAPMPKIPKRGSPLRTPQRPTKRLKAPPSPAAAMMLQAAKIIESGTCESPKLPRSRLAVIDGFGNTLSPGLQDSTDLFSGGILAPPSPAVTPSRLLFSPAVTHNNSDTAPRQPSALSQVPSTISPFTGMYESSLDGSSSPDVGSIWKQPDSPDRTTKAKGENSSTARRPLLELMTPSHSGGRDTESDEPEPLPTTTPAPASEKKPQQQKALTDSAENAKEKKKDRKTYSTAGRPRVRGEYKCGKCGFMPKKAKHDCEEERRKRQSRGEDVPGKKKSGTAAMGTPEGVSGPESDAELSPVANPVF